jgi:malonyl-CoA O-methyltransferase
MLAKAKSDADKNRARAASTVCADFAQLPLASGAFDVLWSNLALHWHPEPARTFAEWKRVLNRNGLLMFSCFGPDTLLLLQDAFRQADNHAHILPFMEMHDLGDRLVEAGFSSPVLDREIITVTYTSLKKMFADVRALGGNALFGRRRGLLGRQAYQRFLHFLEMQKTDGRWNLMFEIIYGHAFGMAQEDSSCFSLEP